MILIAAPLVFIALIFIGVGVAMTAHGLVLLGAAIIMLLIVAAAAVHSQKKDKTK